MASSGFRSLATINLERAVISGNAEEVKDSLSLGADPTTIVSVDSDDKGLCLLSKAAREGHSQLISPLLLAGLSADGSGQSCYTPLHWASQSGHHQFVRRLILLGSPNLEAVDDNGYTPLRVAASRGHQSCVKELLSEGADPNTRDSIGRTPLYIASLLNHTLVVQQLLQDTRCDPHVLDINNNTALHAAAQGGGLEAAQDLVVAGIDPDAKTKCGNTPVDQTSLYGYHYLGWWLRKLPRSRPLVETPTLQIVNPQEQLLWVISRSDNVRKASDLLRGGARPETVGDYSTQPLALAITCNRSRIVSLLLAAGAPLTSTTQGLGLLKLAWRSPDVTPIVQVTVTRVFLHKLKDERRRIEDLSPNLRTGVDQLISTLDREDDTPWRASWPPGETIAQLTHLMVEAARVNCTLTCYFLHRAGGRPSLRDKSYVSPVRTALEAKHWGLAKELIKHMGGCLYVEEDARGRLPADMLPVDLQHSIDKSIYDKERNKLMEMEEKTSDQMIKQQVQEVLELQEILYTSHLKVNLPQDPLLHALLLASQNGLKQLVYLLVKVGNLPVDEVVDPTTQTTALHQAASHGKTSCVILLLSFGAQPLMPDRYSQTAAHLAAMFGHDDTYQVLAQFMPQCKPSCRAGTTPQEVNKHFNIYLKMYHKHTDTNVSPQNAQIWNDPREATKNVLSQIDLRKLMMDAQSVAVNFCQGEAKQVKDIVMQELKAIIDKVSGKDETYRGLLELLGSAADATKLYCPDEYDVNLLLYTCSGVTIKVKEQPEKDVSLSGHKLKIEVETEDAALQGNALLNNLYLRMREILVSYKIKDKRVSLVPPGLTKTQVGVTLLMSWQGSEYPLLLIGVDLVPVVVVPWPSEVHKPRLTPDNSQVIPLSYVVDKNWRGSFANCEVVVLSQLDPQERQVYLTAKTLLSCMKAEPWMPKKYKNQFCWWDSRYWKIPTPAGFCLKNSFLKLLEKKRQEEVNWQESDLRECVTEVFRGMCLQEDTDGQHLIPAKVHAYFGGDCEVPKIGEGAPEIIAFLEENS
ncbi:serine/threonine-protein phosphatase 6 regulatory ankyrin repeat subunit A-like isoform X2 [Homarus americanus]|uniref:serine/threonine-protein phosphatase 6 regulatory ankyrin repeat subunit A-like isoform X2 n=1 Tax=Homarus americanus TaxID=6706 RepID=UPI001C447A50|nr:serine/threonine-protein phosphatase 6 regulatory ankyrin repeat subunit A-like isoform X2 [Homarus americanus]